MLARRIYLAIQQTGRLEELLIEASPRSMERYAAEAVALVNLLNDIREAAPQAEPVSAEQCALRADLEVLSWRMARARALLDGVGATLEHWAGIALDDSAAAGYDTAGFVFTPVRSGMVATHG